MEYRELNRHQSLEINTPTTICDLGNLSTTCVVLQQTFNWDIYDVVCHVAPTTTKQKYKCTSPKFSVNFGGITFENAELIFYPHGDNTIVNNDQISFFLRVPNIRSRYLDVMHSKLILGLFDFSFSNEISVALDSFSADQCLGVSALCNVDSYPMRSNPKKLLCTIKTILDSNIKMIVQPALIPGTSQADMGELYKTQEMADVTFIVDKKELPAHKCILAARCPVFKAMFHTQMKEATNNVVKITDVNYETFDHFLYFIYSGMMKDTGNDDEDLLGLADKYNMNDLKVVCEKRLAANLTIENATQMFIKADLYNARGLKKAAIIFLHRQLGDATPAVK